MMYASACFEIGVATVDCQPSRAKRAWLRLLKSIVYLCAVRQTLEYMSEKKENRNAVGAATRQQTLVRFVSYSWSRQQQQQQSTLICQCRVASQTEKNYVIPAKCNAQNVIRIPTDGSACQRGNDADALRLSISFDFE